MKLNKAIAFSTNTANMLPLCSGANILAQECAAIVLGAESEAQALLADANKVFWLGQRADGVVAEAYTGSIESIIRAEDAELVLLSNSTRDRCIAAKLAVRLNAAVVTDAALVAITDEASVTASRNVYGGAAVMTVKSCSAVTIVLCAAGVFDYTPAAQSGVLIHAAAVPDSEGIELVSVSAKQEESVDIAVAKRVVGVGRGIGNEEKLALAKAFAAKLGAELGCTRPIAEEEHLMSRNRYIGVSGTTIRPEVYFACGISGQVQHMVGAGDSKLIVAINKDAKAPIFSNCDIGLVADLAKVLPALTELL